MEPLTDWRQVSQQARVGQIPIVVMVDQSDCPYCRQVESEYFAALLAGGKFDNEVLFGKISIDEGETILVEGKSVLTREFLAGLDADKLTPTILFLDSKRRELVEKMVGLTTPDYYGYYLEAAIQKAREKVRSRP